MYSLSSSQSPATEWDRDFAIYPAYFSSDPLPMVDIPDIPGPAQYFAPSLDDIRKIIRPVTAMVS